MIYLACDHAGYSLKNKLAKWLEKIDFKFVDCGATVFDQQDSYVDYAKQATSKFAQLAQKQDKLILICGSGVGMSIVANRNTNIRAVLALSAKQVFQARQHNDANCLCIGARNTNFFKAKQMIKTLVSTEFAGGKHLKRIESI